MTTSRPVLPVSYSTLDALRFGRRHTDPPGANLWNRPGPGAPVVLLHGFGMDMATSWFTIAPALFNAGARVFALDYGGFGHGRLTRPRRGAAPMPGVGGTIACAEQVDEFVDRVLTQTGAERVTLVGHSFGGLVAQYYMHRLGGARKVDRFVGLAPTVHGTTACGLFRSTRAQRWAAALFGENLLEQAAGSDLLNDLYSDGDTVPGVDYTVISPRWDTFTTPVRAQRLRGDRVQNLRLSGRVEHVSILHNRSAVAHLVRAVCGPAPYRGR